MSSGALPAQVETIPAPTTVAEAIGSLHHSASRMADAAHRLLELAELGGEAPEMRRVRINPANNGQYVVVDQSYWTARSVGVLNLSNLAPVFVGIGGVSARPLGGAPYCPPQASLVLPLDAVDLELGCDPAILAANELDVFLFRYVTRQPLMLGV